LLTEQLASLPGGDACNAPTFWSASLRWYTTSTACAPMPVDRRKTLGSREVAAEFHGSFKLFAQP